MNRSKSNATAAKKIAKPVVKKTKKSTIASKPSGESKADHVPAFNPKNALKTLPVNVPDYSTYDLPNGMRILLLPRKRIPLFEAILMIKNGGQHDPSGAAGCSYLTGELLTAGVEFNGQKLSKIDIAERIDSIGGALSVGVTHSRLQITASGLSKHAHTLLELLTAIVRYPLFPEEELERERQQMLASLVAKRDQPSWVANDVLMKTIYPDHPFGEPIDGTMESITAIDRDLILRQWDALAKPNGITLAIVGDFSARDIRHKIDLLFADWQAGSLLPQIPDCDRIPAGNQVVIVEKSGAVQANIQLGHFGVARTHPDYYPLLILEQILFIGMSSRFYRVIRAERGLTYSIGGGFQMGKQAGPLVIHTSTMSERTGYMLASIFEVIEKFLDQGPTVKELADAKSYLNGSYPLRFESSSSIAAVLLGLDLMELPDSTISEYRQRIAEVSRQDVLRVAKEHLHPSQLQMVVVGESKAIEPQLKEIPRKISVKIVENV